jgi:arylsulfatase A-like enzyme
MTPSSIGRLRGPAASDGTRGPLLRAAAVAGLMEGLAIARYDVLMHDVDRLFGALFWAAAIVLATVALWWSVGDLLLRFLDPQHRLLAVYGLWAAAIGVGRHRLGDRLTTTSWILLAIGALLVFAWAGLERRYEGHGRAVWLLDLGVLTTAAASLYGRVPDQAHPWPSETAFFVGIALLALLLAAAARRAPKILALAALAVAAVGLALGAASDSGDGPSVLWILVDTTRRDHIAPFGDVVHTPAIERLASQGVRFDDAVTVVPKTPASVASFFTGRYPVNHGVRTLYDRLPRAQQTVAEAFRSAGYDTAAFIDNGWMSRGRGFERGFERFMGFFEVHRALGPLRYFSWAVVVDQLAGRTIPTFSPQAEAANLTDVVLRYLEVHRKRRFFAYVHYFEPHWPYFPPPELARRYGGPESGGILVNHIGRSPISRGRMIFQNPLPEAENEAARRLYRAEIDNTMFHIGRLLAALDGMDLAERTIVAFTADHGHALGEHRYYFHHGGFLYDPSIRIPLVLRWPGRIPAGFDVGDQVRSIDLAPTLLQLAGLPPLVDGDGRSLHRFWGEGADGPRPALLESDVKMFAENDRRDFPGIAGKLRGLRDGRWKLILNPTREGAVFELYDVVADPTESVDLVDDPEHAAILSALRSELLKKLPAEELARIEALGGAIETPSEEQISEEELEMLRSLGYAQ